MLFIRIGSKTVTANHHHNVRKITYLDCRMACGQSIALVKLVQHTINLSAMLSIQSKLAHQRT